MENFQQAVVAEFFDAQMRARFQPGPEEKRVNGLADDVEEVAIAVTAFVKFVEQAFRVEVGQWRRYAVQAQKIGSQPKRARCSLAYFAKVGARKIERDVRANLQFRLCVAFLPGEQTQQAVCLEEREALTLL